MACTTVESFGPQTFDDVAKRYSPQSNSPTVSTWLASRKHMIDSRALRVGNVMEREQGLTRWHCLVCHKRLKTLDKRNHHEWDAHPVKMWIIYIQELHEDYGRMEKLIDEYFELMEIIKPDKPTLPESVLRLIRLRKKEISQAYKWGQGLKKQHPLTEIDDRLKRAKDRLIDAMQGDDSVVVVYNEANLKGGNDGN